MHNRVSAPRSRKLLAAALLVALPVMGAGFTMPAFAQQQGGEQQKDERETTQAQVLTERTFKQLTEANTAIEENRFTDARPILDRLLADERLTPYERAIVLQTRGFLATEMDDYKGAAGFFEQAVNQNALPPDQQLSLTYNLAQIYAGTEQYKKAIQKFEIWFAQASNPQPQAYVAFANALYQEGRVQDALTRIETAIKISDDPKKEWYDFLVGLYYETKQMNKVAATLELLASRYPSEARYFRQLGGVYSELKRERDMLAIYEIAYKAGHLEKSEEFVTLAQLWMFFDNPYRGAVLLEQMLKSGKIANTKENWEILANAWIQAREIPKSIEPLTKAAELDNSGEGYVRLAQAYLEREDWKSAVSALESALQKGSLKKRGQVYLLEGVALFNLDRVADARKAFVEAAKSEEQQRVARQWIRHIDKQLEEEAARQEAALQ